MTESWEPQVAPREARPAAKGFPTGLTIAAALAFVILMGLGVWQLQRLKWKEGVLAHLALLQQQPARPLEAVLRAGGDIRFTRVSFDCPDILSRPRVRLYGVQDAQIVYRQMVACPVSAGAVANVLVDIGYEDCAAEKPLPPFSGPLIGIVRAPDPKSFVTQPSQPARRLWYWRDLAAMAQTLGAPRPASVFVALEQGPQPASGCRLGRAPIPINIPNNHLQYALTWFGLAGALAGVYGAAVFKRMSSGG
jgi:surfeit locus 1 family protein